ncbi:hypothetical protein [Nocardioides plantarum]
MTSLPEAWVVVLILVIGIPLAAWLGVRMLRDPHRKGHGPDGS